MPVTPIIPGEREALARLAEIPPVGSEEREFWLEAADQHGFCRADDGVHTATDSSVLTLMSEARKQGQRDVLGEPPVGPGYPSETTPASSRGAARGYPSRDDLDRLSEAACPGPWNARLLFEVTPEDSDFCDALVNAWRAGDLVSAFAAAIPSGGEILAPHVIEAVAKHLAAVHVAPNDPDGEFDWDICERLFRESFRSTAEAILTVAAGALGTEARSAETGTGSAEDEGPACKATPSIPLPHPPKGQEETPCASDFVVTAQATVKELLEGSEYEHVVRLRCFAGEMLAHADRIELALTTIQAHQEKTGEVQS